MLRRTRSRLRAAHYFLFFYARQKRKSDFERLLKKVFFFFSLKVGLFSWCSCTLTRYLVDVFFSGITTENKSEENEISLLSLLEKLNLIKFSSLLRLFCRRLIFAREKFFVATNEDEFLTKVIAHTQKRQIQNFLSLLSLCFHDNRRTTLLIRFETNFSILVALHIRVVINAAVLFLSSSHFENERVGERESAERRERE